MEKNYSKRITGGILGFPHRKRAKDLAKICDYFKQMKVLDIGCNNLYFDKNIIEHQNILIGCDLNWDDGLNFARENIEKYGWKNVYLVKCMAEYLPLKSDLFPIILCFETLEHTNFEDKVIREISRVSTDNATLIISAPIEFGPILLLKQLFRYIAYHESYFSNKDNLYSLKELFYAGILCNLHPSSVSRCRNGHKGYDYRTTIKMLSPEFKLISKRNTPFKWLSDRLSYGTILIFKKMGGPDEKALSGMSGLMKT